MAINIASVVTRIAPKHPFVDRHYIAEWRIKRGWTQETLAEKLNTTKATISRWESNNRDITFLALAAVAEAFGVTVLDILHDPNEPSADAMLRQNPDKRQGAVEMLATFLKIFNPS